MDNSCSGFPETDTELIGYGFQEIIHFAVPFCCRFNICFRTDIRLDQVIAMDGCRDSGFLFSCIHELQQCHLGRCILHRHTIGTEVHIIVSTPEQA